MKYSSLLAFGLVLAAVIAGGVLLTGCGRSAAQSGGGEAERPEERKATNLSSDAAGASGKGMAAINEAAHAGKYLFVYFFKANDEQTTAMRKVFDEAMKKVADRAQSAAIDISEAGEKAIVDKYDLARAPMPLVLAMAPNGAITGGFPTKFDEQQLLDAFATPGTERVMKSLQDGKLVLVCVQNDQTTSNEAAMQGVNDFKADVRFASATEIVTLDPTDKQEATFLTDLRVPADTAEAVTVFVVPPGRAIGKFDGATSKDALVELITKAGSCGPGGCGPGGCGPAN